MRSRARRRRLLDSFGSPTGLRVNLSTGIDYGQLRAGTDGRWPNGTQLIVETVLLVHLGASAFSYHVAA